MTMPAARISDMHTCPMIDPGPKPHIGGPIIGPGVGSVVIGNLPAAVTGDEVACAGAPDKIVSGSSTVLIGSKPAARMGDKTAHGGVVSKGLSSVLIGDGIGSAPGQLDVLQAGARNGSAFCPECEAVRRDISGSENPVEGGAQ